jgi:hypothetical protein
MSMVLVLGLLKDYRLHKYADTNPIIFKEAKDPDSACHQAYMNLSNIIISQYKTNDFSSSSVFINDILNDVRITRVVVASNEERL